MRRAFAAIILLICFSSGAYGDDGVEWFKKGHESKDPKYQIECYTKALELGKWSARNKSIIYNNRGNAYDATGQFKKAMADYDKSIQLDQKNIYAYNARGMAYYNLEQYNNAIADFNVALGLDPEYAYAYYNRGNVYYQNGGYENAVSDYTKAINIDPDYAPAYGNRGHAYKKLGQDDKASADFKKFKQMKN